MLTAVDPRTGRQLASYEESSAEDVRAAAAAAARAFAAPQWREDARRAGWLREAAGAMRDVGEEIRAVCEAETGLPSARVATELERTCRQLEAFAALLEEGEYVEAVIDLPDPEAVPPRGDIRRMLVPVGPVAVFGASNFPLAFGVAGGDTASALAAGCPVVAKGHPSHPGTSHAIAEAFARTGLPEGAFSLVQGASVEVGEALVDAPEIEAVGFTGSLAGGRALFDRAARRAKPIPVFAEMGSVNPVVVTDAALAERADAIAEGLVTAITGAAGQLCTKPGIVFVPASERGEAFTHDVAERLAASEPGTMLNERLRDSLVQRLGDVGAAAEALTPGGAGSAGFSFAPAAFRTSAAELRANPDVAEECFGPVVLLATYEEDLAGALESLPGQLAASVHAQRGEDLADVLELLQQRVGRLVFNGFSTGVAVCHGMQHGGPYPATTAPGTTSVGMGAIRRFLRPVAWQDAPQEVLPAALRDGNPLGIWRRVNGELTRD